MSTGSFELVERVSRDRVVDCVKSSGASSFESDSSVRIPRVRSLPDDVELGLEKDEETIESALRWSILGMIMQLFGGDVQDCVARKCNYTR